MMESSYSGRRGSTFFTAQRHAPSSRWNPLSVSSFLVYSMPYSLHSLSTSGPSGLLLSTRIILPNGEPGSTVSRTSCCFDRRSRITFCWFAPKYDAITITCVRLGPGKLKVGDGCAVDTELEFVVSDSWIRGGSEKPSSSSASHQNFDIGLIIPPTTSPNIMNTIRSQPPFLFKARPFDPVIQKGGGGSSKFEGYYSCLSS
mmetsp:Transcript_20803/g.33681  ORF Transcript_20803/g.33681 Transcript_20803/m.33681 type:complete len:201 (-) Transcript_20803:33-635(-)